MFFLGVEGGARPIMIRLDRLLVRRRVDTALFVQATAALARTRATAVEIGVCVCDAAEEGNSAGWCKEGGVEACSTVHIAKQQCVSAHCEMHGR